MARPKPDDGLYHVAGILVYATPALEHDIRASIESIAGAVVHGHGGGKIVATLEGSRSRDIADALYTIQRMPGVVSALLVSEHSEPNEALDQEIPHER